MPDNISPKIIKNEKESLSVHHELMAKVRKNLLFDVINTIEREEKRVGEREREIKRIKDRKRVRE